MLDQPSATLDDHQTGRMLAILIELHRRGTTAVVATRDRRLLEIADRVVVLDHGRVGDRRPTGPAPLS